MKGKTWYLVGFLILSVLVMEISCWEYPERKTDAPEPDPRRTFPMEYDCQISYDIFSQGEWYKADSVFNAVNTNLSIHWSELGLDDEVVNYDSVQYYIWPHIEKTDTTAQQVIKHKSYMMAMQDAYDKDDPPGLVTIGWQTGEGGGYTMCAIFVQAIRDNFFGSDIELMEIKTPIHEMGHMRANLTDLCDPNDLSQINPEHDDYSCVMGQGKIAPCTGQDVATNPHFCPMCIEKLKKITW